MNKILLCSLVLSLGSIEKIYSGNQQEDNISRSSYKYNLFDRNFSEYNVETGRIPHYPIRPEKSFMNFKNPRDIQLYDEVTKLEWYKAENMLKKCEHYFPRLERKIVLPFQFFMGILKENEKVIARYILCTDKMHYKASIISSSFIHNNCNPESHKTLFDYIKDKLTQEKIRVLINTTQRSETNQFWESCGMNQDKNCIWKIRIHRK